MDRKSDIDKPIRGFQQILPARNGRDPAPCGLCGQTVRLTKTHVPPQCAGNTHKVGRSALVVHTPEQDRIPKMVHGRPRDGGLYVFGLCPGCNGLQSTYDGAYGDLVRSLKSLWVQDWGMRLKWRCPMPSAEFRPGSVARSILIGMMGINPTIRDAHPVLAKALIDKSPVVGLPEDVRLRVALARGLTARIAGPNGGSFGFGNLGVDRPLPLTSLAHVYFPPLAWQLSSRDSSLLDRERWADVSDWLAYDPAETADLATLCPPLPPVAYPSHVPWGPTTWVQLWFQAAEVVEVKELPKDLLKF
ncbi:hypothetical protein Cs7R123_55950 [Catellatospora sp. TT07R-123]|uniref:hypothetical protein n=1 Tax=Catellatospora sp. TT07R-123 TaxID=2733863 RepID=UPI001B03EEA2|nr:hypothetical protein [Catellatospora sp. TT07R-123]GHJ48253.1 hypothetical protein Cs7R123_55950 [Catellatospora sp. TT07R-123]